MPPPLSVRPFSRLPSLSVRAHRSLSFSALSAYLTHIIVATTPSPSHPYVDGNLIKNFSHFSSSSRRRPHIPCAHVILSVGPLFSASPYMIAIHIWHSATVFARRNGNFIRCHCSLSTVRSFFPLPLVQTPGNVGREPPLSLDIIFRCAE